MKIQKLLFSSVLMTGLAFNASCMNENVDFTQMANNAIESYKTRIVLVNNFVASGTGACSAVATGFVAVKSFFSISRSKSFLSNVSSVVLGTMGVAASGVFLIASKHRLEYSLGNLAFLIDRIGNNKLDDLNAPVSDGEDFEILP